MAHLQLSTHMPQPWLVVLGAVASIVVFAVPFPPPVHTWVLHVSVRPHARMSKHCPAFWVCTSAMAAQKNVWMPLAQSVALRPSQAACVTRAAPSPHVVLA